MTSWASLHFASLDLNYTRTSQRSHFLVASMRKIGNSLFCIPLRSLVFTGFLLASWPVCAGEKPFVVSTSVGVPLYSKDGSGLINLLVAEIFNRLDINYKLVTLPPQRAIVFTSDGTVDATVPRAAAIEEKQPDLIRIQENIFDFEYMAYTKNPAIKIKNWDSLKPYSVGIINGWKIVEQNTIGARSLLKVNNFDQLLGLLEKGRVEVAILDRVMGSWRLKQTGFDLKIMEPPLTTKPNYMYVNKKHKDLAPAISKVLQEMKRDGSYEAIYMQTLSIQY